MYLQLQFKGCSRNATLSFKIECIKPTYKATSDGASLIVNERCCLCVLYDNADERMYT